MMKKTIWLVALLLSVLLTACGGRAIVPRSTTIIPPGASSGQGAVGQTIDPQREVVPGSQQSWTFLLSGDVPLPEYNTTLRAFLQGYIALDIEAYYGCNIKIMIFDAVPKAAYLPAGQTAESAKQTYVFAYDDTGKMTIVDDAVMVSPQDLAKVKAFCERMEAQGKKQ